MPQIKFYILLLTLPGMVDLVTLWEIARGKYGKHQQKAFALKSIHFCHIYVIEMFC